MLQKIFIVMVAAVLAVLLTASQAQAWGAAHCGYTSVGAGGVQHYGTTTASGPYGSYSGSHYSSASAGGTYHEGSAYGTTSSGGSSAYHYSGTSSYGGYHAGGFSTANTYGGAYAGGVYRAW
jgi:hypothetical protein